MSDRFHTCDDNFQPCCSRGLTSRWIPGSNWLIGVFIGTQTFSVPTSWAECQARTRPSVQDELDLHDTADNTYDTPNTNTVSHVLTKHHHVQVTIPTTYIHPESTRVDKTRKCNGYLTRENGGVPSRQNAAHSWSSELGGGMDVHWIPHRKDFYGPNDNIKN